MRKALAYLYAMVGLYFVVYCIYMVYACGWTTIVFDQWRIYDQYFSIDFPWNIFMLQNGHRPAVPGLFFLADIYWFNARNISLLIVGMLLLSLIAAMISVLIWRDKELTRPVKVICISAAWMFSFWLANSRVLLHGNESMHCYLPILALIVSILAFGSLRNALGRSDSKTTFTAMLAVCACCFMASFSFGFGMIAWPAIILAALVTRLPARIPLCLAALFAGTLVLYCFVLPGDTRVQGAMGFHPLENLLDACYWLGSIANRIAIPFFVEKSIRVDIFCPVLGGIGMLFTAVLFVKNLIAPGKLSRLEVLCLTVLAFGAGCAFLVAICRNSFFKTLPYQRTGPRYLPWVILYWHAMIVLLALYSERALRTHARSRWPTRCWWILVCLLPFFFLKTNNAGMTPKTNHRKVSMGLVVGVQDDELVKKWLYKNTETVYRAAGILKEKGLGMFAWPPGKDIGRTLLRRYKVTDAPSLNSEFEPLVVFADRGREGGRFRGTVSYGRESTPHHLVVADDSGTIQGLGFLHPGESSKKENRLERDFSGYIRAFAKEESYRYYFILEDGASAVQTNAPTLCIRSKDAKKPVRVDRIFLVTLDTLRADHVSCYGYPRKTTPFLDRLARYGVLFKNAFCQMSTTSPSHASIFTSLHPCQHKVLKNGLKLDDMHNTLAECLKEEGFVTGAAVSTNRNFRVSNIDQGFDFFDEPSREEEEALSRKYRPAEDTVEKAVACLKNLDDAKKIFFWLHLYDSHRPYEKHDNIVSGLEEQLGGTAFERFLVEEHKTDPSPFGGSERMAKAVTLYDAETYYADQQLESFFNFIDQSGLGKNSLWIITADHGEGLGNHDWLDHGKHIYNEQLRVPLVIYTPDGWIRHKKITGLVELLDIYPTVVEAVKGPGHEVEQQIMGYSLLPHLIADKEPPAPFHRIAFAQRRGFDPCSADSVRFEPGSTFAAQDLDYKYLHRTDGKDEFFVLKTDLYEENNRIKDVPGKPRQFKALIDHTLSTLTKGYENDVQEVDAEILEKLKELGYIK